MTDRQITALVLDRADIHRAVYVITEDGRTEEVRHRVIGWAAVGEEVVPLRVDKRAGRAVLIGRESDPDKDRLIALVVAGESLAELGDDVDERVRDLIRADRETEEADEDAEADED